MWPGNRQLALLLLFSILSTSAAHAVKADTKHVSRQINIRIVSINQDKSGNFVLLNTTKGLQLPFPGIRVFSGQGGDAIMTVDFPSTVDAVAPASIAMPNSSVRLLHVGQFAATPPITRISLITSDPAAFKRVQFHSEPGQLSIRLPKADRISHTYVQPLQTEGSVTGGPQAAPDAHRNVSEIMPAAAPQLASMPPHAPDSTPQLRGPIALENGQIARATDSEVRRAARSLQLTASPSGSQSPGTGSVPSQSPVSRSVASQSPGTRSVPSQSPGTRSVASQSPGTRSVAPQSPPAGSIALQSPVTRSVPSQSPVTRSVAWQAMPARSSSPSNKTAQVKERVNIGDATYELLPTVAASAPSETSARNGRTSAAQISRSMAPISHSIASTPHLIEPIPPAMPRSLVQSLSPANGPLVSPAAVLAKDTPDPATTETAARSRQRPTAVNNGGAPFGSTNFKAIVDEENHPVTPPIVAALPVPSTGSTIKGINNGTTDGVNNIRLALIGVDPITLQVAGNTALSFKAFRLHEPERLVIDIEGDGKPAVVNAPDVPPNPWIKAVRLGSPDGAPNISRIVLDLNQEEPALIEDADAKRTSISFTLQANCPEPVTAGIPKRIVGCRVVLDAGHGGTDPGAQRGDVQEKEITLQIVDKLKRDLEARGVKVSLTRSDDTYVSLEDRVRITNGLQPDAFVSVHINSLETNNGTHGIETYFQTDKSKNLAQLIHGSLVKELGAPDRSVRKARFYVINHTPIPAILAEVGFISNKDERDKLISSDYQSHIAEALTDGVMLYLAENKLSTAGSGRESGTISAMVPSARPQSFTQILHSPISPLGGNHKLQTGTGRRIQASRRTERAPTKLAHQQLKFKKHRLASLRS